MRSLVLLLIVSLVSCTTWASNVELKHADNQIEVLIDSRLVATYYFAPTIAKPFLFLHLTQARKFCSCRASNFGFRSHNSVVKCVASARSVQV